ncbi:MAG: hypothetical protein Fur007_17750 [Rhodoferax sp.]
MQGLRHFTMRYLTGLLKWLLKAAIFFALFAFALNNQHNVTVHFFFGRSGQAPLVLVVLIVLAMGMVVGVLGMLPWWWRQRKTREPITDPAPVTPAPAAPSASLPSNPGYADGI